MLKTRSTLTLLAVLLLMECGCGPTPAGPPPDPGPDSLDCPAPYRDNHGYRIPAYVSRYQKTSSDGRYIAYVDGESTLHILDLRTYNDRIIDVQGRLPSTVKLGAIASIHWCPYDNSRFLIHAVTLTDTAGDGKEDIYGQNSYILSIEGGCQRVTPEMFGEAGSEEGYFVAGWLQGSTPQRDSLHMGGSRGIYIPQEQKFIPNPYPEFYIQSGDRRAYLGLRYDKSARVFYPALNGREFHLPRAIAGVSSASWSPDSKKIALSVMPKQGGPKGIFEQIWIIDAEQYLRELPDTAYADIIDLQVRFCMYSFLGAHAQFITNNTLVVSMHQDGESSSLWEITTTGRKLRQLTFLP